MRTGEPGGRLFRKYVVVLLILVGGVLLVSSAVELYFSYQASKAALVRVEYEKAEAAAARIEQFVKDIERQVRGTTEIPFESPVEAREQREIDYAGLLRNVAAIMDIRHLDASGKERLKISRLALDVVDSREDLSQAPAFLDTRSGATYFGPFAHSGAAGRGELSPAARDPLSHRVARGSGRRP